MWIVFNISFTFAFVEQLQKSCNKIYHLASNLLSHYLRKCECLTVQCYSKAIAGTLVYGYIRFVRIFGWVLYTEDLRC